MMSIAKSADGIIVSKTTKSLRIKDEETCRLIHELAALTGETLTEAVRVAVREKLERELSRPKVGSPSNQP